MYNILISGYYGFDNIGDESILRTLVSSLRELEGVPVPELVRRRQERFSRVGV